MQVASHQVGTDVDPKDVLDFLDDQQRGGYAYIHGYCSSTGEVAHHWVQGACHYENMVARSVAMIDSGALLAEIEANGLEVVRGKWVNGAGVESPTNRKSVKKGFTVFATSRRVYDLSNEQDRATIVAEIARLREQLTEPKTVDQGYHAEAKGAFSREGEAAGVLYLRGCMTVHKHVIQQGEYKPKASAESTAIRETMRRLLPVGRYRAYKLHDNFEHISLGGLNIIQGANLSQWELALTEAGAVAEAESEANAEAMVEAWVGEDEDNLPM